jgi:hypothetical protein
MHWIRRGLAALLLLTLLAALVLAIYAWRTLPPMSPPCKYASWLPSTQSTSG